MRNMTSRMKLVLVAMMVMYVQETVAFPGDLRLVNNGYDGLIVAISENVPQDHCNHVIHGLKVRIFMPSARREISNFSCSIIKIAVPAAVWSNQALIVIYRFTNLTHDVEVDT